MNKREAGRLGGLATANKYGSDYMKQIARKGAASFWQRYKLLPASTSNYAIVDRATNKIISFTNWSR